MSEKFKKFKKGLLEFFLVILFFIALMLLNNYLNSFHKSSFNEEFDGNFQYSEEQRNSEELGILYIASKAGYDEDVFHINDDCMKRMSVIHCILEYHYSSFAGNYEAFVKLMEFLKEKEKEKKKFISLGLFDSWNQINESQQLTINKDEMNNFIKHLNLLYIEEQESLNSIIEKNKNSKYDYIKKYSKELEKKQNDNFVKFNKLINYYHLNLRSNKFLLLIFGVKNEIILDK